MDPRTFDFAGRQHAYIKNNRSADNERKVELSLAYHFVQRRHHDVVEVGNVTRSYWREWNHFTIDLNERHTDWKNYFNHDVLYWTPSSVNDGALSISTLEHTVNPPDALMRMLDWGNPHLLVTLPLGYYVKTDFQDGPFNTTLMATEYAWLGCDVRFLQRISEDNQWKEISLAELKALDPDIIRYNKNFPSANVIGVWIKGGW